jgi:hypothetical protein
MRSSGWCEIGSPLLPTSFSPARLKTYARDLSEAVYELSRERQMSIFDLRKALRDIPGADGMTLSYVENGNQVVRIGDRSVEVGPMASHEEIRLALQGPFIRTERAPVSVSGYEPGAIKARLDALKQAGKSRRDAALAKLDQAGKKHEAVSQEIEKVAAQIEKEADDALQEFAQFTNGVQE